jgi:hypothetical protein
VKSSDFVVNSYRSAGKVEVRSAISPISLQAGRPRLADLKAMLGQAIGEGSDFLMTHDVEVTLTWFVSEHNRYQTHTAADLDNVIKPLLDAATGPEGVMIDDNQVQSIRAAWMTPGSWGEGFDLTIESLNPEDTIQREGTAFVEFAPDTCYVLPGAYPEAWPTLIEGFRAYVDGRAKRIAAGIAPADLAFFAPIARPWHSQRLRLQRFPVLFHTHDFGAGQVRGGEFELGRS